MPFFEASVNLAQQAHTSPCAMTSRMLNFTPKSLTHIIMMDEVTQIPVEEGAEEAPVEMPVEGEEAKPEGEEAAA